VFLQAYCAAAEESQLLPASRKDLETLLDAFLLERAIYELRYELDNRPARLGAVLRDVLPLIAAAPERKTQTTVTEEGAEQRA
jgi:maltose alpha-D-glucosyltransferase/alpha-amylase